MAKNLKLFELNQKFITWKTTPNALLIKYLIICNILNISSSQIFIYIISQPNNKNTGLNQKNG